MLHFLEPILVLLYFVLVSTNRFEEELNKSISEVVHTSHYKETYSIIIMFFLRISVSLEQDCTY